MRSPSATRLLVTAPSKEVLERHVLPRLEAFLADRGLVLNDAKTRIVSIEAGFNFLGFTARKFHDGKLLIRPEKAKVLAQAPSTWGRGLAEKVGTGRGPA